MKRGNMLFGLIEHSFLYSLELLLFCSSINISSSFHFHIKIV